MVRSRSKRLEESEKRSLKRLLIYITCFVTGLVFVSILYKYFWNETSYDSSLSNSLIRPAPIIPTKSTKIVPVTPPATETSFKRSEIFLYSDSKNSSRNIMKYEESTALRTQITRSYDGFFDLKPKYSKNGEYIAYCRQSLVDSSVISLYVMRYGNEIHVDSVKSCHYTFTVNSKEIIYVGSDDDIYIYSFSRNTKKLFLHNDVLKNKKFPMMKLDGTKLFFVARNSVTNILGIYYEDLTQKDSKSERLMYISGIENFLGVDLSPDGNEILILTDLKDILITDISDIVHPSSKANLPSDSTYVNAFWAKEKNFIYIETENELIKKNVYGTSTKTIIRNLIGSDYSLRPIYDNSSLTTLVPQQVTTKVFINRLESFGTYGIYQIDSSKSSSNQLTTFFTPTSGNTSYVDAKYSYDGKFIVFCYKLSDVISIYMMDIENNETSFVISCQNNGFNFVPNQYKLVYVGSDNQIYQVDIENPNDNIKLTSDETETKYNPSITLDGHYLYYITKKLSDYQNSIQSLYRKDLADPLCPNAKLIKQFSANEFSKISLSPNTDEYLFSYDPSTIILGNFSTEKIVVLTDFIPSLKNFNFMWSQDGKWIYFYDIYLITRIRSEYARNFTSRRTVETLMSLNLCQSDSISDILTSCV